jgi:hypothetical protein
VERGALFSELDYMNVLQLLHRYGIPVASPHLPYREAMRFIYLIREKGCPITLLCVCMLGGQVEDCFSFSKFNI